MITYKSIKTIEEAESILKEKYNIVSLGLRQESDEEYLSFLTREIIKQEDEKVLSIIEEIIYKGI